MFFCLISHSMMLQLRSGSGFWSPQQLDDSLKKADIIYPDQGPFTSDRLLMRLIALAENQLFCCFATAMPLFASFLYWRLVAEKMAFNGFMQFGVVSGLLLGFAIYGSWSVLYGTYFSPTVFAITQISFLVLWCQPNRHFSNTVFMYPRSVMAQNLIMLTTIFCVVYMVAQIANATVLFRTGLISKISEECAFYKKNVFVRSLSFLF